MATNIHHLPEEVLLELFSHFSLVGLISIQGVCTKWYRIIHDPFAPVLSPARRSLLALYRKLLHSASDSFTKPPSSISFTAREELLKIDARALADTGINESKILLPEDFATWLVEWPSRAVISGISPIGVDAFGYDRSESSLLHVDLVRSGNETLPAICLGLTPDPTFAWYLILGLIDYPRDFVGSIHLVDMHDRELKADRMVGKWTTTDTLEYRSWAEYLDARC